MKQPNYQENWDKKDEFMREVAPIIAQLHKKCLELHIPLILAAQYVEKDEMSQIQSAAAIDGTSMNVNKRMILIAHLLTDNEFFDQLERAMFMARIGPFDHPGRGPHRVGPEDLFGRLFGANFLAGDEDEEDEDD